MGSTLGLVLTGRQPLVAIAFTVLLGAFGFLPNPALNGRVFANAQAAPTLAAGINVAAFNTGITVGPWLGGRTIDAGFGYTSTAWDGAILGGAALVVMGVAVVSARRGAKVAQATALTPDQVVTFTATRSDDTSGIAPCAHCKGG